MATELRIERLSPTLFLLAPQGSLTLGSSLNLIDAQFASAFDQPGPASFILDLTEVPYLDSAGLGILVHTFRQAQQRGHKLRICNVPERIAQLLRITTTDSFLPIDPSRETSQAVLSQGS